MARRKLVAGNWKMNGLAASATVVDELALGTSANCDVLVCPPATLISRLASRGVPARRPGLPPGALGRPYR